MRIAIDAAVLGSGRGGDETYLRGLLAGLALVAVAARDRIGLFARTEGDVPPALAAHPAFRTHLVGTTARVLRYTVALPRAVARAAERYELLLSINHAPPVSPVPRVLIVHDLSFLRHPEFYPRRTLLRLRALVGLHVRQARLVVTGSEFSRRDLLAAYRLPADRVVVVPPALAAPAPAAAAPPVDGPYFLYVGNLHPRKNLGGLLRAFALARERGLPPDHRLVIAGAPWWSAEPGLPPPAALTANAVRMVGRVGDAERDALIRGAVALVYPSLFEGIGLPPLEAMALGTPVIASDAAALPETCGDAAWLVNARDAAALAAALVGLAADAERRARLRERGLARAAVFTERRTGDAALAALSAATARPGLGRPLRSAPG